MKCVPFFRVILLFSPLFVYGEPEETLDPQKIYIQSTQIAIGVHEIFIYAENEWISVESIGTDPHGLYAFKYGNPDRRPWWCPNCGYCNTWWDKYCQNWIGNSQCLTPKPSR